LSLKASEAGIALGPVLTVPDGRQACFGIGFRLCCTQISSRENKVNFSPRHVLVRSAFALACATLAFAHIRIAPTESAPGAREKYTMRVPNEKQVNTIRVEGEFPAGLQIYDFEFKPGWKIDFKKDDSGKIVGATWTGKVQPYEFVEFGMLGINPKEETNLVWKFVQYYEDGTKEEFTGPVGSFRPSPVTVLKKPEATATGSK
jgi:uncharacterized protein YcnI